MSSLSVANAQITPICRTSTVYLQPCISLVGLDATNKIGEMIGLRRAEENVTQFVTEECRVDEDGLCGVCRRCPCIKARAERPNESCYDLK